MHPVCFGRETRSGDGVVLYFSLLLADGNLLLLNPSLVDNTLRCTTLLSCVLHIFEPYEKIRGFIPGSLPLAFLRVIRASIENKRVYPACFIAWPAYFHGLACALVLGDR